MKESEIKAEFMVDIIDGKFTLNEAKQKIRVYEEKYGTDFFADYDIEDIEKNEKFWNNAYLKELKLKGMTGMASKQFFLHLAEVSDYVHSNADISKNKDDKKSFIIAGIISGIITGIKNIISGIITGIKNICDRNRKRIVIASIVAGIIITLVIVFLCLSKSHSAAKTVASNKSEIISQLKSRLLI